MGLTIPLSTSRTNGDDPPIHWPTAKAEVLAQLNIIQEYEKLGVKFPSYQRGGKDQCWVACHAVGREDNVASAAVHAENGRYIDKGGDGSSRDFFEFALEYGPHGKWIDCFRHYAEQVEYKHGRVEYGGGGDVLEARHDYRDAEGNLAYGVFKYRVPKGDKTFRQYPWKNGRWVKERGCMEGVAPLPYRLDELLSGYAGHDYVLWTEGEKDVDRAYDAGFVATTSHMGAGNFANTGRKFIDGGLLPAHDYVVLPDNDPLGRAYAAEVADALKGHFGAEATVKVVPLPDVPHKGDLSDWLDLGGTPEALRALIAAAPAWEPGSKVEAPEAPEAPEPPETAEDEDRVVDYDDPEDPDGDCTIQDLAKFVSEAPWAWTGWIPSAALTLLASEAGAGKTRLMMDLHRRAHHGLGWPDGQAMTLEPGGKALWIVADNHHDQMVMEAKAYGLFEPNAVIINTRRRDVYGGTTLACAEDLADLEARILRVRPYWVVIDTITNTGDYKTQDAVDAKRQYKPLQEIAQRTRTPIVCVTHTNAIGKVLGRRAVEKVRTVLLFSEPDRDNQPQRRKLWVEKSFALKPAPLGVTVGVGAYEYDDDPPEEPEKAEGKFSMQGRRGPKPEGQDAVVAWLMDYLGAAGRHTTADVRRDAVARFARTTYDRALKHALEQDLAREYRDGGEMCLEIGFQNLKVCP